MIGNFQALKAALSGIKMQINPIILILVLSAFNAYIPHMNYPYPLHVDEWFHITTAEEILHRSEIDLYSGASFELGMERAWHVMLAGVFYFVNPLKAYLFLILIISVLATYSVYSFAKRYGERTALVAAFLAAIIPSNVTIGGPALLVPVNLSLIFIPLALKFAFETNYIAIFLSTLFLLYAHPPTAVTLLILLGTYAALKKEKLLLTTMLLAIALSLPNYLTEISRKGIESVNFPFWLFAEETPKLFGYIPTIFFIFGFYMMTRTKDKQNWTLIIGLFVLLIDIFLYARTSTSYLVPYTRIFMPLLFIMSVIAAYSMAKVKNNIVLGVILFTILTLSVQHSFGTEYYHIINETEYEDIAWIGDNVQKDRIILADPWIARPIPAITGMQVFTVLPFGPDPVALEQNQKATDFFDNGCVDDQFLKENRISIVYSARSESPCTNPNLVEIHENTYRVLPV